MCSNCMTPYPEFRWEPPIDPPADDPNESEILFSPTDLFHDLDEMEYSYGY